MARQINIAIDGPAGAGKSTVARAVAKKLNYIYIDTGAMYRALTLKAIRQKIDLEDLDKIADLAAKFKISIKHCLNHGQQIFLESEDITESKENRGFEDITEQIRNKEVTQNVSKIAKIPAVRKELVKLQQNLAKDGGVVMDGRDIGTNVLPLAQCKIFLTASIEKRAERRYVELIAKGYQVDFHQLLEEIKLRDKTDRERSINPLVPALDANIIDTSEMSFDEVVEAVLGCALTAIRDRNLL